MKKLTSAIVLALIALIWSTDTAAQFRYGPMAGVTVNSMTFKQPDLINVSQQVGYTAGIQGELMFPGLGIGIDLGAGYNQQGAMVNLGQKLIWSSEGYGKERIYVHNLCIPIHLRFKYTRLNGFEEKIAPLVYGGPEFNIMLAHGHCGAMEYSGGDIGLTVGGGAEIYRNWQVTLSYTWGMSYAIRTKLLDDFSARSRQWAVRVAYLF